MSIKYRDHRGSLSDSMETEQTFETADALFAYLRTEVVKLGFGAEEGEFTCASHGLDNRIDWDCHLISLTGFGPLGFTDRRVYPPNRS